MIDNDSPQSKRPTFLVVDDDPMVRKLVSRGLASLNPEAVLEVEDGLEAQQVLREKAVDVVITDVLMPNMDGRELMKWAQEHCPEPLWIVLSGLDTFDAAIDALHLGAFDYLAKPPEVERVRVAVRNAMDQLELMRDRERLYGELEQSNTLLGEKVAQLEELCRMLEDQAEVIHADLARAEVIQRALLPQVPPKLGHWCVESLYRSGSYVGGDFYDIVVLDNRYVGLVIADAAGHGVAAAMLSVLFKHRLQLWDEETHKPLMPKEVLRLLNRALYADLTAPGAFITAAYLLLDRRSGYLRIASAGHPPCIWTSPAGQFRLLERSGPALGLEADPLYKETSLDLEDGDRVLLYTDGVLEGGSNSLSAEDLAQALIRSEPDRAQILRGFYDTATHDATDDRDDITMILLERGEGASRFDDIAQPRSQPTQAPSPTSQVRLLQGVLDRRAYMSIAGTGTWMRSPIFFESAVKLLKRWKSLTIDLGACEYLDSTFLGTLHEIVMSKPDSVQLQRVRPNIRALFEELSMQGVLNHAVLTTEPLPQEMEPLKRAEEDSTQQAQRVLKAHEILASLSDENREQFRDVVESMRADIIAAEGG